MLNDTSGDIPDPPADLGDAGRSLWLAVLADHDLGPDGLATLAHACRLDDELVVLREAITTSDPVVLGSTGQPVVSALFDAVRKHRDLLVRLLDRLGLDDVPTADLPARGGHTRSARSAHARRAAEARWGHR